MGKNGQLNGSVEKLEDRLCVMLYRASHAMTGAYRQVLEPLGLTYPQYTVLSVLWQRETATIKELGAVLGSDYSTMSPLIGRLEAADLVRRSRGGFDQREVLVGLTEDGRQLQRRAGGVQDEIARATGLSDAGRTRLVDQLQELTNRLQTSAG